MIIGVPNVIRRRSMLVLRAVEEINREVNDKNVEQTEHGQKAGVDPDENKESIEEVNPEGIEEIEQVTGVDLIDSEVNDGKLLYLSERSLPAMSKSWV